jgi:hypothetical protein
MRDVSGLDERRNVMSGQGEVDTHDVAPPRGRFALPPEVEEVFREFRTCEFSSLARDGTPITWPVVGLWQPEEARFVLTTSIGLPRKAFNVRRDERGSLLFSDPTASGLQDPPAVLVQGDAEAPEEIRTSPGHLREYWHKIFRTQPAGKMYGANALMRYLFDWYYMRIYIYVKPKRILVWPDSDFTNTPLEVDHVG